MCYDTSPGGLTLVELVLTILLLALLAAVSLPGLQRARDGLAVRAARDAMAAQRAAARWTAVPRGGAALVVEPAAARVWIVGPVVAIRASLEPVSLRAESKLAQANGQGDPRPAPKFALRTCENCAVEAGRSPAREGKWT
jgi:type II secretory pathway pseudopilin PulG